MVDRRLARLSFAFIVTLTGLLAVESRAQIGGVESLARDGMNLGNPLAELRARSLEMQADALGMALEGAVDPDAYTVGPGDMFSISIGGAIPVVSTARVGADGYLVLPQIGRIEGAGWLLSDVNQRVRDALQENFRSVPIGVSLLSPRLFYVHVTGAVPLPGKFLVTGVSRVEDAVLQAYAKKAYDLENARAGRTGLAAENVDRALPIPSSERPAMTPGFRPSLRTIRIMHTDSTESSADLLTYYATGDRTQNPYLLDGDVIVVSSFQEEREAITVSGPLPFTGRFPYRPGDRLTDLLVIAAGSMEIGEIGEVRIARRTADGSETITATVSEIAAGSAPDPLLEPGDFIHLPELLHAAAGMYGWVRYPGTYPIVSGKTTVTELVRSAGGLKPDADLRLAYVDRNQPTLLKGNPGTTDLDFFSRAFFAGSSAERRVVVDVAAIIRGEAEDYVLLDGDTVVIPRLEETVFVMGNVAQPGYVPYRDGQTAGYYIEQAGGESPLSEEIYVIDSVTRQTLTGASAPVYAGATVYVDREGFAGSPELQALLVSDRTSRRQLKLLSTQTVISGISAIAAIITTVVAVTR